jgi:hypothetical protein
MERYVFGPSAVVQAQFGKSDSAAKFSLLSMFDGNIDMVEGFDSRDDAERSLSADGIDVSHLEIIQ